jgi:octaprenyl-diphosphate synthase
VPPADEPEDILDQVEARIRAVASTAPPPIDAVAGHLITAGGKRVRPRVVLYAGTVGGERIGDVVSLAAAAELIHNASLLHDDVIDEAPLRRGRPASRVIWGNARSVLAGDHLMACALELLEDAGVPGALRSMLATMRRLVEAEVVQLAHRGAILPDVSVYERVIRGKTAALFSWCAHAGARAGGADDVVCQALAEYGEELGVAFQLLDDVLDLDGSPEELGKSLFADIAQGVATLPVVLATQGRPELARKILAHVGSGDPIEPLIEEVWRGVRETGADVETRRLAALHVERARSALGALGGSPARQSLDEFAVIMLERRM